MRIQISEASPAAINYFTALALSQGLAATPGSASHQASIDYVGDPALAAPLIAALQARGLVLQQDGERQAWTASIDTPARGFHGPTAHLAALRCHLAAVFGDFLDLPEALIPDQLDYRNLWSQSARCAE